MQFLLTQLPTLVRAHVQRASMHSSLVSLPDGGLFSMVHTQDLKWHGTHSNAQQCEGSHSINSFKSHTIAIENVYIYIESLTNWPRSCAILFRMVYVLIVLLRSVGVFWRDPKKVEIAFLQLRLSQSVPPKEENQHESWEFHVQNFRARSRDVSRRFHRPTISTAAPGERLHCPTQHSSSGILTHYWSSIQHVRTCPAIPALWPLRKSEVCLWEGSNGSGLCKFILNWVSAG